MDVQGQPGVPRLCGKIIFASKKDARKAIREIRKRKSKHKQKHTHKVCGTYECKTCGGWHLTSISNKEWSKRKRLMKK